jgi:SAM-dependent methyltransferase
MVQFQKLFHHIFPGFLKRLIDPETVKIDKFVISNVSERGNENLILDAGAGECRFKDKLRYARYIAVDATYGDQSWDYSKIDVASSLDCLPFESDIFDIIICTQVLEHVQEPQSVLKELFRTLKRGGVVLISAPQGWGVHQAPHDYFRFTCYALSHLLEQAGFEQITTTPSCGYFSYLANRLTVFPKALFWQIKSKFFRIVLSPLELLSYVLFVGVFPIILNTMDFLDRKKDYTLNYLVKGTKINER